MCIRIVRLKEEVQYDMDRPLEEQIRGSKQIVVNYDPKDPSIDKFFEEAERLCKNGISASLNIKFNHNGNLLGARLKKEMNRLAKDLDFNELIKLMVTTHAETDRRLEEMSTYCQDRRIRVKA